VPVIIVTFVRQDEKGSSDFTPNVLDLSFRAPNDSAVLSKSSKNCDHRPSKVVDFGTNRKGVCDFLLVINSNFGPILHCL